MIVYTVTFECLIDRDRDHGWIFFIAQFWSLAMFWIYLGYLFSYSIVSIENLFMFQTALIAFHKILDYFFGFKAFANSWSPLYLNVVNPTCFELIIYIGGGSNFKV